MKYIICNLLPVSKEVVTEQPTELTSHQLSIGQFFLENLAQKPVCRMKGRQKEQSRLNRGVTHRCATICRRSCVLVGWLGLCIALFLLHHHISSAAQSIHLDDNTLVQSMPVSSNCAPISAQHFGCQHETGGLRLTWACAHTTKQFLQHCSLGCSLYRN